MPVDPQVAPPIRMSNAAVPLLAEIEVLDAVLQNPEAMVGAEAFTKQVEQVKFPVVAFSERGDEALTANVPAPVGKVRKFAAAIA